MRKTLLAIAMLTIFAGAPPSFGEPPAAECAPSYFQLSDGSGVDIAPLDEEHFRWRRPDGTSGLLSRREDGLWSSSLGWTGREDGVVVDLSGCGQGVVRFDGQTGQRVEFETAETRFSSGDAQLAGRLVLPQSEEVVPILVLVHGSENASALERYALQRLLPAQGIGVFVYDKRGTGSSGGAFTHDIVQLARDATIAAQTARSLAGARAGRLGYYGTSQGGWTAPLAANMGQVDFVVVGYGLAVSPAEEDEEALALDMQRNGFGPDEVAKAQEIGAAAINILRSDFRSGYEELRAVIAKYEDEPWFGYVRGNITGIMIAMPEAQLREWGPQFLPGILPDYDPLPVLHELETPQLWILGAEDIDAPYLETYRRLMDLRRAGHRIAVVVYPDVEHGLYAFEVENGERLSTRQPASLQRLIATFARGAPLDARYDDAQIVP